MSAEEQEQRAEPTVLRSLRGMPGTILNQQKTRVYFIANPGDESTSLGLRGCLDVGWHRIHHKRDPERLHSGTVQSNGDVTWKGQVLLWLSEEDYKTLYAETDAATAELFERVRGPGGVAQVVDVTGKLATDIEEGEQ